MNKTLKLHGTTVGDIKEFLEDIPDTTELIVVSSGDTGFVDGVELEIASYDFVLPDLFLNIKAESGFY